MPPAHDADCINPGGQEVLRWVEEVLGCGVHGAEEVQSLWSGYGSILRVALNGSEPGQRVIVKHVQPPANAKHPRGWTGQTSHTRKLRSYQAERAFYGDWLREPVDAYRTARCFAAEQRNGGFRFLLEDLDVAGFPRRCGGPDGPKLEDGEIQGCLEWLAAFHGAHLRCGQDGRIEAAPPGFWPIGTYWHLATRQDELAAMQDQELREAAPHLDALLRSCPFQTTVHGDAKVANFCFSERGEGPTRVAAVDFQYVGGGCGIQDVAYFLSSCLDDAACERHAPRHLDTYFEALRTALPQGVDADAVEQSWRRLYPAAWADFHRFLNGWAPDHWKIHRYTRRMTREALADL